MVDDSYITPPGSMASLNGVLGRATMSLIVFFDVVTMLVHCFAQFLACPSAYCISKEDYVDYIRLLLNGRWIFDPAENRHFQIVTARIP